MRYLQSLAIVGNCAMSSVVQRATSHVPIWSGITNVTDKQDYRSNTALCMTKVHRAVKCSQNFSFSKAKLYYAIWSQAGSKLVAYLQVMLDDRPNFWSLQVCDQLRTCLRPDSVMEFGFESRCDQVRAGLSYLDISSNLLEPGSGSKLVADLQRAEIWPII